METNEHQKYNHQPSHEHHHFVLQLQLSELSELNQNVLSAVMEEEVKGIKTFSV